MSVDEDIFDKRWYDEVAREVRHNREGADEGTVWVLLVSIEGELMVAFAVTFDGEPGGSAGGHAPGPTPQSVGEVCDELAGILDEVDPPAVVLAVTRSDGQPQPGDWRLWEEMRTRTAALSTELVDLLVVGDRSWWAIDKGRDDFAA